MPTLSRSETSTVTDSNPRKERTIAEELFLTFIKNAPLLILDEPLHGLDMEQKRLVARIIERMLESKGRSLVYVTHYEQEIPPLVDHTFRLTKNKR